VGLPFGHQTPDIYARHHTSLFAFPPFVFSNKSRIVMAQKLPKTLSRLELNARIEFSWSQKMLEWYWKYIAYSKCFR
jgi:hypothetical protein